MGPIGSPKTSVLSHPTPLNNQKTEEFCETGLYRINLMELLVYKIR